MVLKDNDLKYKIRLSAETARDLLQQLTLDVEFLYSIGVMGYSLLSKRTKNLSVIVYHIRTVYRLFALLLGRSFNSTSVC